MSKRLLTREEMWTTGSTDLASQLRLSRYPHRVWSLYALLQGDESSRTKAEEGIRDLQANGVPVGPFGRGLASDDPKVVAAVLKAAVDVYVERLETAQDEMTDYLNTLGNQRKAVEALVEAWEKES